MFLGYDFIILKYTINLYHSKFISDFYHGNGNGNNNLYNYLSFIESVFLRNKMSSQLASIDFICKLNVCYLICQNKFKMSSVLCHQSIPNPIDHRIAFIRCNKDHCDDS